MNKKEIKILITGDFCPLNRIDDLINAENYGSIFNDFLPLIKESDIAITNLECPVTQTSEKIKKTGPNLKAPVKSVKALVFAGFKLVTLANNHIMDFGVTGLDSTIEACNKSGIDFIGVGSNLQEARKPKYNEINGIRVAFINFCENEWATTNGDAPGANPLNPVANYYDIKEAKANADHVIVIVHGGHEHYSLPSPRMQETYRFFVDAGASAVVSHHTHCFSGFEVYNNAPIFYSLGNFVFDWNNKRNSSWNIGYAVQLEVTLDAVNFLIHPYRQGDLQPGVLLLNMQEKEEFENELSRLNNFIGNKTLLQQQFNELASRRKAYYKYLVEPFNNRIFSILYARKLVPSFLTTKRRNLFLNITRCEAHRDLLIKSLTE
ncbi:MAG: CapA family protein [Mariniphaga sp.]